MEQYMSINGRNYEIQKLEKTGITMPKMLCVDLEQERILKEYICGPTIYDLVLEDHMEQCYLEQMLQMTQLLYLAGLNIDFSRDYVRSN